MSETFPGTTGQAATQFVIPQEKIGLLLGTGGKTFKRIGSLFKVHIHLTSGHHQSGEWVSIYGKEDDRARAKEYIMSMCNPAVEEKIVYPADLHEHLVGKGGKTHRYLESNSSAVITFSTACTAPNEHTAHIRGSKDSVQHASTLVKEIMRKTQKRRQKEQQPNNAVKGEELDKELHHILKITNNTALWDNLKNESEQAKRNYINHLKGTHKFTNDNIRAGYHDNSTSPGSSNDSGPEEGVFSNAELIAFASKLHFSEEDATKVLDRMGNGVNKNQFLANLVQFTRENDINKPQPEQMLPGAQDPQMAERFRSNYSASPMFDPYNPAARAAEFAMERPNGHNAMPLGMSARSIAPSRHEARSVDFPGMPGDYLSPNRQAHFGSFGQQENPLTLEQLINQHPSYAQQKPHPQPHPQQQPTPHPHIKTPGPPQLGHHLLSANAQLHGHPQHAQQAPPQQQLQLQQQQQAQLQAQQLQAQQLQAQHLQAQQLQQQQHHSQLQSQSQSDKILLQLLLLDQKDKEERDRIRQKQEIEAVLLSHYQHNAAGVPVMTSEEQLAQLLLKRRMQQQNQQQKSLYAQQVGYPGGATPQQQLQSNNSNNTSGFASAGNTTLNSSGNMSTASAPGGCSGPMSPTRPFGDIFSPLSNGPDLYRNSFENEFGLDFLREDSQSTTGGGEDVSDLIKQLKLWEVPCWFEYNKFKNETFWTVLGIVQQTSILWRGSLVPGCHNDNSRCQDDNSRCQDDIINAVDQGLEKLVASRMM